MAHFREWSLGLLALGHLHPNFRHRKPHRSVDRSTIVDALANNPNSTYTSTMAESNATSKRASKRRLAALQALQRYVSQQTSLLDKGVKHELASDIWYRPHVDVREVTVWELLAGDGSTLSIVTVDHAGSPVTPVSEVRIETWSLNGAQGPRLERQQAKRYSHVIFQSLRYRMSHIDVGPLTREQEKEEEEEEEEEERAARSTEMTMDITAFLSNSKVSSTSFSGCMPGNCWEELAVKDNIVVLARRRGLRGRRNQTDDRASDSGISDLFDKTLDSNAGSQLNVSDDEGADGSQSEDGFRPSDLESDGDVPLSPIAYSGDGTGSFVDYESSDRDDGESLHSLHLGSGSDAEGEAADPDDIPNGPHTGALDTCKTCKREKICLLHCHTCDGDPHSLSRQPPKTAVPLSAFFAAGSIGQWTSTREVQDPPGHNEHPRFQTCESNPAEKELAMNGARIRLLPVADKSQEARTEYNLSITAADFVDDHAEEETINLSKRTSGTQYSSMCNVCQAKFEAPCVSYRCKCKNGDWDACPGCYLRNKTFHDSHHSVRKTFFEIGYHDRPIAKVETTVSNPSAVWDGRLSTLEEVERRDSCPLCRLVVQSLQEARKKVTAQQGIRIESLPASGGDKQSPRTGENIEQTPDPAEVSAIDKTDSGDDSETEEEVNGQITLSWRAFGWNRERWHA
ncbi:hypothetical protein B0T14DRAFT_565157 [Immersiella caudata]|uniref:Uncharacterized protein n=1 Tax=Immersiella caudata TaxID=314043 RepID=A0AA39WY93_9PEZI|nr:hypothetical protein B0T14DRAFT_565157 [Immersiella caudata]